MSHPWSGRRAPKLSLIVAVVCLPSFAAASAPKSEGSCLVCHSAPDFLVTNKKLYDYYQEWSRSIHKREEVTCSDCHGGNPDVADKAGAHGGELGGGEASSAVNFQNIPRTCGQCHDQIYDAYRESKHFEHLVENQEEQQGPNCVTCHGSINVEVLNVETVSDSCARCHNEETEIQSEVPDRAERVLHGVVFVDRFYRYVAMEESATGSREFFNQVDRKIDRLSVVWHTFDLDDLEEKTRTIFELLSEKHRKLRQLHSPEGRRVTARDLPPAQAEPASLRPPLPRPHRIRRALFSQP